MRGRLIRATAGVAATANMISNVKANNARTDALKAQTEAMNNYNAQGGAVQQAPAQPAVEAAPSMEQQLQQLSNMQAQGLITAEEYDAKKKQILGL
jgi:hypothetical protein